MLIGKRRVAMKKITLKTTVTMMLIRKRKPIRLILILCLVLLIPTLIIQSVHHKLLNPLPLNHHRYPME